MAIQLVIFDVDGVLTNGQLIYTPQGESKAFHVHDGLGIKKLLNAGIQVAIITKRTSEVVARRMQELGVTHVYQGVENKNECFEKLLESLSILPEQCAYLGDDEPDIGVMEQVGQPVAVANATPRVKAIAQWVTKKEGGMGAARELCEAILSDE